MNIISLLTITITRLHATQPFTHPFNVCKTAVCLPGDANMDVYLCLYTGKCAQFHDKPNFEVLTTDTDILRRNVLFFVSSGTDKF